MKCEVDYCIYNREFFCILKEIQLNASGMCEECLIVSIPDDNLNELKKINLKNLITYGKIITSCAKGALNLSNYKTGTPAHCFVEINKSLS